MMIYLLYLSLLGLLYVYLGYPLIVCFLSWLRPNPVVKEPCTPKVSILIAAFNECDVISATLKNKLSLDYPAGLIEIIVVSDGSDDGTDEIVREFQDRGVRLLRQEPRAGKTSALNMAVPQASGELLVFSDANSLYDSQALLKLVANFSDTRVGYVTGKMIYTNADGKPAGDGCSAYMKYENVLRDAETALGSVVGVNGGIDAMRKDLYRSLKPDQLPDFVQPLKVVEQGYRVIYEPEALLQEDVLLADGDEYRMRVRVALRAFWALSDMRGLLLSKTNLLFSWQLWSHKLLRYLCFIFLVLAFISNLLLLNSGLGFALLFIVQCTLYVIALSEPWLKKKSISHKILTFIRYFYLLNRASAHAFYKFLRGQKQVTWTPRKG